MLGLWYYDQAWLGRVLAAMGQSGARHSIKSLAV